MTYLEQLLQAVPASHVYIQTHSFPDPDAVVSALGLSRLLEYHNIRSTIIYSGEIERYSTLAVLELFGIPFLNIETLPPLTREDMIILVDSQMNTANIFATNGNYRACIDHHQTFIPASYFFSDIRSDIGACASMIASYFLDNHYKIDQILATAFVYAMRVDTDNFTRHVSSFDLFILNRLFPLADQNMLNSLSHCSIQLSDLTAYTNALQNIKIVNSIAFANVGMNCPSEVIAMISDFILNLWEVTTSIVYSLREDGIKLSLRTENPKYNVGKIVYEAIGGGGHRTMAGGFIPRNNNQPFDEMIASMENRILETIQKY